MEKSIFEKFSFKQVLLFCLFLIAMDSWLVFNFMTNRAIHSMPWLSISVGILLIAIAVFIRYRTKERMALVALGISFIMDWLGNIKFISIPLSSSFSILFVIGALYFYRISYKTSERTIKIKPISPVLLLIIILILAAPPLFFWIIGMLSHLE